METLAGYEISQIHRNANWCKFLDRDGWNYSAVQWDEHNGRSESMTGPQGQQWMFVTITEFQYLKQYGVMPEEQEDAASRLIPMVWLIALVFSYF